MEYLSAGKILIVDLASSDISEEELSDELVADKLGGAAVAKSLYQQHEDGNPVVISTGLLTGTLFPGAAAAFITARSPVSGNVCHCPITLKVGLEIQYSGFDYIVIKGSAAAPSFLWIHDGVADISDAAEVWGQDVWDTTAAWRKAMGDDLIQTLVIGPAGEKGSDLAQICCNYWSSADCWGFGKLWGQKNLKGLAFRGMGLLEIADAEEFVELALDVLEEVKEGAQVGRAGIGDICVAMGAPDLKEWIDPVVHRHSACYNTPFATNTFLYLDEDPQTMVETENEEPGFLVTDPYALLGFKNAGLSAKDAGRALKACARQGLDAAGVAELSQKAGHNSLDAIMASLDQISGEVTRAGKGIFSPWCPDRPLFGQFDEADADLQAWWERRMAVAYIFGIHPLFAVMSPEVTEEDLLAISGIGTELELSRTTLEDAIAFLLD